jgi:hypothetical protein
MIQVEADRAYLSRILVLVKQIEAHAQSFTANHADLVSGVITKKDRPEKNATLNEVFHHRMREFYYKPTYFCCSVSS